MMNIDWPTFQKNQDMMRQVLEMEREQYRQQNRQVQRSNETTIMCPVCGQFRCGWWYQRIQEDQAGPILKDMLNGMFQGEGAYMGGDQEEYYQRRRSAFYEQKRRRETRTDVYEEAQTVGPQELPQFVSDTPNPVGTFKASNITVEDVRQWAEALQNAKPVINPFRFRDVPYDTKNVDAWYNEALRTMYPRALIQRSMIGLVATVTVQGIPRNKKIKNKKRKKSKK